MTNPYPAPLLPFPAETPIRLSEYIRRARATGGPGRKLHYAAVARGELRVSRLGRRWLYVTPEDYARWLNERRIEMASERRERLVRSADAMHRERRTVG